MPEMQAWWCDTCERPFSDMTVKPFAVCPECLSRCFTLVKATKENPVASNPEKVVS